MRGALEAPCGGSDQIPEAFHNVMFSLMELLESAAPEERLAVLSAFRKVYCPHCGHRHDEGGPGICQCWNDE